MRVIVSWSLVAALWASSTCLIAQSTPVTPSDNSRNRASDETLITRQMAFSIPFSVEQRGEPPREVQLMVSSDRGATWQLHDRRQPSNTAFAFRASRDGEYWFTVRTVDQQNQIHPVGDPRPELKVLVDTIPPKLEFEASIGRAGEVLTSWRAVDQHLAPDSLQVEYQPIHVQWSAEPEWRVVAIELPANLSERTVLTGQSSWWPEQNVTVLKIRASVRDRAGNLVVVNRRIVPPPAVPSATVNHPQKDPSPPDSSQPIQVTTNSSQRPARKPLHEAKVRSLPSAQREPKAVQYSWTTGPDGAGSNDWRNLLPEGERLHMTNARQITLQYDSDSVDLQDIKRVELWATRDGGKSWRHWGDDPDQQSPISVELPEQGVYGFRAAIMSASGLASGPPKSGDLADLWVGVDRTKPTARILSAPFAGQGGTRWLVINWQALDQRLADDPISLAYSNAPHGPWTVFANRLSNTGQYNWHVDPSVQGEIYLRLEVRDEAGNVQFDQPGRPIVVAGQRPRPQITGFAPAGPQLP